MAMQGYSKKHKLGQTFRPGERHVFKPKRTVLKTKVLGTTVRPTLDTEPVFATTHEEEINKAENIAAGLPPDTPEEVLVEQEVEEEQTCSSHETISQIPKEEQAIDNQSTLPVSLLEKAKATARKVFHKVKQLVPIKQKPKKEIIINAESLEIRVALLVDGRLEDFHIERTNQERLVGSIFKGKVRNLDEGLKAAFVDIGYEKNAFLHYWDILPAALDASVELVDRGDRRGTEKPKITLKDIPKLYPPGSDIVVQVSKGQIGTKGPRLTTHLALPGRLLVLLPNSDQFGISRKIEDPEERQRLKKILRRLNVPEGMGLIIRTAAQGQQLRYFVRELAYLLDEWQQIQRRIQEASAPVCVFREPDLIERTVRDFLTDDVERIVVDDYKQYERIKNLIGRISKRAIKKVIYYNESQPIFDKYNITRQLEEAFARKVQLKSGGYIVIDETEALVSIDVNTGKHKSTDNPTATILQVNLEAADEICRQLRLRNIGGLIVVDFIDMKSAKARHDLYQRMKENLKKDRARTHVLPISQFGLMEITRQRHTESVRESIYDDCPYCKGRGKVKSTLTMSVEVQRKIAEVLKRRGRDESDFQIKVFVHPAVYERLVTEDQHLLIELEKRYFGKISVEMDHNLHIEEFKIINALNGEELAYIKRRNE